MLKLAPLNCPAAQARLMQNRGMEARAVRATLNNAGRVSSEDFVLSSSQAGDADRRVGVSLQRVEGEVLVHFVGAGNCSLICSPCEASPSDNVSYLKCEIVFHWKSFQHHKQIQPSQSNPIHTLIHQGATLVFDGFFDRLLAISIS